MGAKLHSHIPAQVNMGYIFRKKNMGPLHPRFKEKRLYFSRTISKNGPEGVLNFGLGRGVPLGILKCHHPSPIHVPILKEKWPIHVPRYMRSGPSICTTVYNFWPPIHVPVGKIHPWRYQNNNNKTSPSRRTLAECKLRFIRSHAQALAELSSWSI